ncbi:MAG: energy transducer TonB, partial [Verrucomicrobiota bacterium]
PKDVPAPQTPDEAPMGTNLQGDGPNAFGLGVGGGGGMIGGTGTGKGGKGGSKYGFYAGQVQSRVVDALRNHKKTRSAALDVKVRIWLDSSGRVTRATLAGTSGKPDVDAAIRDEILTGLQLQNPPPEGMPMPIVMRLSATRPN